MSAALKLPAAPATLADLLALPEEANYELIDGELVPKDAASGRHGEAQVRLGERLGPFNRKGGGPPGTPGGWRFASEALVLFSDGNVYKPDIAGWRREHLPEMPEEVPIRVRPDWICEILSTNRMNDLVRKKQTYHRSQVPHYWIVDLAFGLLMVHRWSPDGYTEILLAQRGDRVRAEPFGDIEVPIGVFFGDDEE